MISKYIKLLAILLLTAILVFTASCSSKRKQEHTRPSAHETKEMLMRINKTLTNDDKEKIEKYISNNSIKDMKASKTGLYHLVFGQPNGKQVKIGNRVTLKYNLTLLDSTVCYTSAKDGLKTFKVGQGGVETGLEEGILLMQQGQSAKFIIPPHLAHGLVGDGKRIPARAIIVYNIELIKVEE